MILYKCNANCGMQEWTSWTNLEGDDAQKYKEIARSTKMHAKDALNGLGAIVMFSGANWQRAGDSHHFPNSGKRRVTPHLFATWLRKQGEKVVSSGLADNLRHTTKIKAYLWVPSPEFRKKIIALQKKVPKDPWG